MTRTNDGARSPARLLRLALVLLLAAAPQGCARERLTAPADSESAFAASSDGASPIITVRTESFAYTSVGRRGEEIFLEVPANQEISIHVDVSTVPGIDAVEYRWAVDPMRMGLGFRRPRFEHGWSDWLTGPTTIVLGPYAGGEEHFVVIDARDSRGRRARLTIRIQVVAASFERELLIVDDTRLAPDEIVQGAGCVEPPSGFWPTAAELDTFLFARGGVPWRCYPAGTLSPPGLFAGYPFDTLGTNTGAVEPGVRLETVSRYRHVIWIVDPAGAGAGSPLERSALRSMSEPGRLNALAQYVRGGGKVWLLGGGGARATLLALNSRSNDVFALTLSNAAGELVPGTFMYDLAHWRSEIQAAQVQAFVRRELGRGPAWPGAPDYAQLPLELRAKTPASDPYAAGRIRPSLAVEYLSAPNVLVEHGASALDTLYRIDTFLLPPEAGVRAAMTYYHGVENPPLMFSGFDIWSFTREDCQALVDFVLQDVWGLARQAPAVPVAAVRP